MNAAGSSPRRVVAARFRDLDAALGQECAVSGWHTVDQDAIDRFAALSGDHHWLHVDVAKAARGEYGATLVHGFLTAALLSRFHHEAVDIRAEKSLNIGFDRLRFVAPVRVGSRLRGRFTLAALTHHVDEVRVTWDVVVDLDGEPRPALVARWLTRHYGELPAAS